MIDMKFELKIPKHNKTTHDALADMERSKGKGIRGVDVSTALAELKAEDDDELAKKILTKCGS